MQNKNIIDGNASENKSTEVYVSNPQKTSENTNSFRDPSNNSFFKSLKAMFCRLPIRFKIYLLFTTIPTLLFFSYNFFIASPMYTSETKFAVRTISPTSGGLDFASQIFNVPSTSMQEAKIVEDYLNSYDVVDDLNKNLHILEHYSNKSYDFISRLTSNPTYNEIISFWHKVSLAKVNTDSSVISLSVRAYTPDMAQKIVETALVQCENLINSMNERARKDALLLAQSEVNIAKEKFDKAQDALKEFRNQHQDLDLQSTASGLQGVIIELEGQATAIRTQLSEALAYMQEDAPSVKSLRTKLLGIEKQLEIEKQKVTSLSTTGESINTLAGVYESLTIDIEFARKQLAYAMTSYEKAKLELVAKNLYVVNIAKPSLPDESLYPKTFLFTLYLFITLNFLYFFACVVVAAIKEHLGFIGR